MPLRVPTSGIVLVSCLSGKGCVGHCDAVDVMRLELKCKVSSRHLCDGKSGLRFPMVGAGLESGCRMVGEMVVKRLWLRAGWSCPHRGWEMVV